ncbi:hypothetical protein Nepgr_031674 [Nepenthes gracilis]|uniref:H(+)-exporting diphosphatase n=1 Tax=Nepenthes gracilis TaxID=150966 RepID=A0AAD3TIK9_NEPGR|nr:hypothetical protein Nepgr_031674 [Nepenthes gracilis]
MRNNIYANAKTTLEARKGAVMGFLLVANGLLVLYIAINLFKPDHGDDWGSIAGICGNYATPSYAALIVASISSIGVNHDLITMCILSWSAQWVSLFTCLQHI